MFKEISDLHETNQRQMKADVTRFLVRQLIVETIGIIKGKRDYKIQGNMRLGATITSSTWDEFNRG